MKVTLRSRQTEYIHRTELVWPRTFIVRSWCNHVEWLYVVGLCLLYCTVLYCTELYCTVWQYWLYGVKKISIKWLRTVKVTLKVINRWLLVFCWSCDEGHLKWDMPSLQFVITDRMSLILPLNSNDWSIPLRGQKSLGPLKMSLEMAHKVIVPQKKIMSHCDQLSTILILLHPHIKHSPHSWNHPYNLRLVSLIRLSKFKPKNLM